MNVTDLTQIQIDEIRAVDRDRRGIDMRILEITDRMGELELERQQLRANRVSNDDLAARYGKSRTYIHYLIHRRA